MTQSLPAMITSPQNPRVKLAARLRDRRQRNAQGRFTIDGARELLRALDARVEIVEAFYCESLCRSEESRQALTRLRDVHCDLVGVSPAVYGKLAYGDRDEGLVAVARATLRDLADLQLPADALVAILEGVEKPGNLGAILRSADGAGVSALILLGGGADAFNPNCIRASLGTVFTVPVCSVEAGQAQAWLRTAGFRVLAARPDARLEYHRADFCGRTAIVLGSEAAGLSDAWAEQAVLPIKLPMLGAADSLNVSVAAAVLFYEALRQRSLASE